MWYTVRPGDTLFSIAQRFRISLQQLQYTNQLTGDYLFPGQQIFIPVEKQQVTVYIVQAGDTLYSLAVRFGTTVGMIKAANALTSTQLSIGQSLYIPIYVEAIVKAAQANIRVGSGSEYDIIDKMVQDARLPVFDYSLGWYKIQLYNGIPGWISQDTVHILLHGSVNPILYILGFYTLEEGPSLPGSFRSFVGNTWNLSETGLFMFRIKQENPTQIEKFGQFTDSDVQNLVAIAHRNNIKILPVVHNLLYRPGGQPVSRDVVRRLVATPESRSAFTVSLINLIQRYNFDGVNIDFEDVNMEDSDRLSLLYTEIGSILHKRGYFFSASVPSRTSDLPLNPFSNPFNYSMIGKAVDQFVVMLYNEHGWPGSGPGPVVSIGWMEKVLRYTLTKVPKNKVIASVSVFGFDFNVTTGTNTYVTFAMAVQLAQTYNKPIIFDQASQTPMFSYQDAAGNQHEVWFEDVRSILAKARLASSLGISGLGLWRLGMEDPAIWPAFSNILVVKKF